MTDAVVDEHARLQEGRHGGGGNGRRGGARRVLVDDKVVGGGCGGRVAAAEKVREGRREAGSDGASDGSGEHLFPTLPFSRTVERRGGGPTGLTV